MQPLIRLPEQPLIRSDYRNSYYLCNIWSDTILQTHLFYASCINGVNR
uniref:Uncharacterized protein n=1 Tax=Arundo donax TaxID=35708 RepID=A0A0A9I110_ARUDO